MKPEKYLGLPKHSLLLNFMIFKYLGMPKKIERFIYHTNQHVKQVI